MSGTFCLVLHGHLPWVMHHGRWPHGEDWLLEAMSETWLPLLGVLDTCAHEGIRPAWTVGLTPILLEQLAQPDLPDRFVRYLEEHRDRAERDAREFRARGELWAVSLAEAHAAHVIDQRARFAAMGGDIIGAFGAHALAGRIEILSSNATHGYHPLLLHDACARAQVRTGLAASERRLGFRPRGVWLPECAYRPPGEWRPPVVHGDLRHRAGVAGLYAEEGVRWFVVDEHLITRSEPVASLDDGRPVAIDPARRFRDVLEPHRVVEDGVLTEVTVIGRCGDVAERVWNAEVGYPGDGRYREFHKRHGLRGLPYWRVTDRKADLGAKAPYDPAEAHAAVYTHGDHFAALVRDRLAAYHGETGRRGVVCTPFDAELFGHWWAEGPSFLLEVARRMHHDPSVQALTLGEMLERFPADKAASLPEGSWGASGDHRVWLRAETRPVWTTEYRAEDRFLDLWHRAPWRTRDDVRLWLTEAGRQLLLLQASDWPFVISTAGAVDYGTSRVLGHAARFADLCDGVEDLLAGHAPDLVAEAALAWCRAIDPVFPDLDLSWWTA